MILPPLRGSRMGEALVGVNIFPSRMLTMVCGLLGERVCGSTVAHFGREEKGLIVRVSNLIMMINIFQ